MARLEDLNQDELESLANSYSKKDKKRKFFTFGKKKKMETPNETKNTEVKQQPIEESQNKLPPKPNFVSEQLQPPVQKQKIPEFVPLQQQQVKQLALSIEERIKEDRKKIEELNKKHQEDIQQYNRIKQQQEDKLLEEKRQKEITRQHFEREERLKREEMERIHKEIDDRLINKNATFNEESDYKIATFIIKVKSDNIGAVLTKIGGYAEELNNIEEVEHCDLNIENKK